MEHIRFSKPAWFVSAPERNLGKGPGLPVETAYFRICFGVSGKGELRAVLSASSRYSLFVNGVPAARGPCKGDRMQHYCDELDLGGFLREGQNVIACKVVSFPPQEAFGRGKGEGYADIGPFSVIGTASGPCLLFAGELKDQSGQTGLSTGYAPWQAANDAAVSWLLPSHTMVFCHEEVEAEKIPSRWDTAAEDIPGFVPVIKRWKTNTEDDYGEIAPLPLFRRPIPMLEETERALEREIPSVIPGKKRFSFLDTSGKPGPVTLAPGESWALDLDAGELTTGYVILETEGGKGGEIRLTYAESYGGPFSGGSRGNRMDFEKFSLAGFQDIYRPGGGKERYEFFWFKTFRILRVEITVGDSPGASPLILWPVKYRETGYPLECKTAIFPGGGAESWVAPLWDISVRTLRRCMHETYEDCPYYEQMQYTFDTRLQMLFHYYLNGDTRLGLKTISDFHRSMLPEGIIQSRYPTNVPQVIPTFAISWLSMLLDYHGQTGDTQVLERYRPAAEAIMLWFRGKKNAQGFIESLGYWNFIDWAPEWNELHGSVRASYHGPSTIQNLMYLYGLELLGRLLDILGFRDLRDYYLAEGQGIRYLVLSRCFDQNRGLFTEGPDFSAEYTQHTQVWAVLTGTVKGEEAAALMRRALKEPGLIQCTFPLKFYLFRALEAANLYGETASQWEDWKRFLPLNLSTIPETPYDDSRSDCHAWSSLLLYEYPAKMLGVYPLEPGYKAIGIKPLGFFLGRAAGKVYTPLGMAEVSWNIEGKEFAIEGLLPPGSRGQLTLPSGAVRDLAGGAFSAKEPWDGL
jgi:hypothetical protein